MKDIHETHFGEGLRLTAPSGESHYLSSCTHQDDPHHRVKTDKDGELVVYRADAFGGQYEEILTLPRGTTVEVVRLDQYGCPIED
jgi:hypothetical protein